MYPGCVANATPVDPSDASPHGGAAQPGPAETGAAGGQVHRSRHRQHCRQHGEHQWRSEGDCQGQEMPMSQ